jgi:tetratricopeptide (TPR) repeat protein
MTMTMNSQVATTVLRPRLLPTPIPRFFGIYGARGYGKTTLLQQYLTQASSSFQVAYIDVGLYGWQPDLSLEDCLRQAMPELIEAAPGMAGILAILKTLTSNQPLLLAFDEFNALEHSWGQTLTLLLRALPQLSVALTAFEEPLSLDVRVGLVRSATIVRGDALRFTAEEAQAACAASGQNWQPELFAASEGWPLAFENLLFKGATADDANTLSTLEELVSDTLQSQIASSIAAHPRLGSLLPLGLELIWGAAELSRLGIASNDVDFACRNGWPIERRQPQAQLCEALLACWHSNAPDALTDALVARLKSAQTVKAAQRLLELFSRFSRISYAWEPLLVVCKRWLGQTLYHRILEILRPYQHQIEHTELLGVLATCEFSDGSKNEALLLAEEVLRRDSNGRGAIQANFVFAGKGLSEDIGSATTRHLDRVADLLVDYPDQNLQARLHLLRGQHHHIQRQTSQAQQQFRLAQQHRPHPNALVMESDGVLADDPSLAFSRMWQAFEVSRNDSPARVGAVVQMAATLLNRSGNFDTAQRLITTALEMQSKAEGNFARLRYLLLLSRAHSYLWSYGSRHTDLGQLQLAKADLNNAIEATALDPNPDLRFVRAIFVTLADVELLLGNLDLVDQRLASVPDPDAPRTGFRHIIATRRWLVAGDMTQARHYHERSTPTRSELIEPLQYLANQMALGIGNPTDHQRSLDEHLERFPHGGWAVERERRLSGQPLGERLALRLEILGATPRVILIKNGSPVMVRVGNKTESESLYPKPISDPYLQLLLTLCRERVTGRTVIEASSNLRLQRHRLNEMLRQAAEVVLLDGAGFLPSISISCDADEIKLGGLATSGFLQKLMSRATGQHYDFWADWQSELEARANGEDER